MKTIDTVWIAISMDDEGNERITSFMSEFGWIPLIATDDETLRGMSETVRLIAEKDGEVIRIARLTLADVEIIDGRH